MIMWKFAYIGFQEREFAAKVKVVLASSLDVLKSYKMTDRSVEHEASIDVSIWLNDT
jgi:hypothetical protein